MDNSQKFKMLLTMMELLQISFPDIVFSLVSSIEYQDNSIVLSLTSQINETIQIMIKHSEISQRKVEDLMNKVAMRTYVNKVANLA